MPIDEISKASSSTGFHTKISPLSLGICRTLALTSRHNPARERHESYRPQAHHQCQLKIPRHILGQSLFHVAWQ